MCAFLISVNFRLVTSARNSENLKLILKFNKAVPLRGEG